MLVIRFFHYLKRIRACTGNFFNDLKKKKNKNNFLKFKPKYQPSVEENEQTMQSKKKSNEKQKLSYAAV